MMGTCVYVFVVCATHTHTQNTAYIYAHPGDGPRARPSDDSASYIFYKKKTSPAHRFAIARRESATPSCECVVCVCVLFHRDTCFDITKGHTKTEAICAFAEAQ